MKKKQKTVHEFVRDEIKYLCTCGEWVTFPVNDEISEDEVFAEDVDRFCPECGRKFRLSIRAYQDEQGEHG